VTATSELQRDVSEPSFAVDQTTGRITTTTTLDRERTPVFRLTALAVDSRNTSMSATANVTVYVADKNDNRPVIAFPSPANYTVQVRPALPCPAAVSCTPPPVGERSIAMSMSVCLFVCLCGYISGTTHPNFTRFSGQCSLWPSLPTRARNTLCTSGFADDVMFLYG